MNLPPLDPDKLVPVFAVIAGVVLLYRASGDRADGTRDAPR